MNVFLLPTDKPSRLIIYSTILNVFRLLDKPIDDWKHKQHIYITSAEEIKDGDWFIHNSYNCISIQEAIEVTNMILDSEGQISNKENNKKIVLTTDQDLIKDGVQAIDDEFLEWFCSKNPSCEYIKTEKWLDDEGGVLYSRIIPKEEPKEFDIRELNRLDDIEIEEMSNDWATMSQQIKPKQETLEEAAKNYINNDLDLYESLTDGHISYDIAIDLLHKLFTQGAKWQQEQDKKMYSEEDLRTAYNAENEGWVGFDFWFEQFKKK
jgi:hypothetical protein